MEFCTALLSMLIVGAYEYRPGLMYVERFNYDTQEVEELIVYTEDYISCWENGVPVRQPTTVDGGGGPTPSDT